MPDSRKTQLLIQTKPVRGSDLPAPAGANYFQITRLENEYQMLIGNVNLVDIHVMVDSGKATPIQPQITHRFLLSQFAFQRLKKVVDELSDKMAKQAEDSDS